MIKAILLSLLLITSANAEDVFKAEVYSFQPNESSKAIIYTTGISNEGLKLIGGGIDLYMYADEPILNKERKVKLLVDGKEIPVASLSYRSSVQQGVYMEQVDVAVKAVYLLLILKSNKLELFLEGVSVIKKENVSKEVDDRLKGILKDLKV